MFNKYQELLNATLNYLKSIEGHDNAMNVCDGFTSIECYMATVYNCPKKMTFELYYDKQSATFKFRPKYIPTDAEFPCSDNECLSEDRQNKSLVKKLHHYSYCDTVTNIEYTVDIESVTYILTDYGVIKMIPSQDKGGGYGIKEVVAYIIYEYIDHISEIEDFINKKLVLLPLQYVQSNFTICTIGHYGLKEKTVLVKPVECDLSANYNDDLPYKEIEELLYTNNQELILFHGEPGTGKTTLIKKLIHDNPSVQFTYFDCALLSSFSDGELFDFFERHKNQTLILEDCEKLLASRNTGNPILHTMLNLTDGIIGEALNIKFICTFNCPLSQIDKAVLREGRLKLIYNFKKLSLEKTKNLLPSATEEMTLSQIYCNIIGTQEKDSNSIGF